MTLPAPFIEEIKPYLPSAELEAFVHALTETEPTTCLRYNPGKARQEEVEGDPIGWNEATGRYLKERPNFTLDPLMHAGVYYVQEASSQFVSHVARHLVKSAVTALDLCAAPGGKSTALLSALPDGSQLVSNEIDRRRARILAENITKWGNPNVTVTSNAPADFSSMHHAFDVILTDVPCSGEGMFRKDEGAVADWSLQKVEGCVSLQRQILRDIWPTLKPGGLMIYGTCTFNVHEDEEMLEYICQELGATALSVPTDPAWNIHQPLKGDLPCYRFMPHFTQGEGLFMAVVQKDGEPAAHDSMPRQEREPRRNKDKKNKPQKGCEPEAPKTYIPASHQWLHDAIVRQGLYILQSGVELGNNKGKDFIPAHALALTTAAELNKDYPRVELDLDTALNYLRHEAITLDASAPRGYVIVTYHDHPLGFVKNIGNRSNNLYPQEWRIRFL